MNDYDPSSVMTQAPVFWRSVEQGMGTPAPAVPGWNVEALPIASRRRFMKLMAAALAMSGAAGCSRETLEHIVPYRTGPQQTLYGKPVFYATAIARQGYGVGVLVECNMGRPTKIEGNPAHPASLGATDAITQAEVLQLWDPDRSQSPIGPNGIASWEAFLGALASESRSWTGTGGEGVHVLTETVASPSLHARIEALRARYPRLAWHQYQPINRDSAYAGARLAYGAPLETLYRFDRARVVLALDGDFLGAGPAAVRYAHDWSIGRNAFAATRSRLYAAECTPSLTGAAADHRIALRASDVALLAQALAHALGFAPAPAELPHVPAAWLDSVASDLAAARGASLVIAGERQPPLVHAIAHLINERLGNVGTTVMHTSPVALEPVDHAASMRDLALAMHSGDARAVLIVEANPVYTAPPELELAAALAKVPFTVHLGTYRDETARACRWHVPAAHALESWSDIRAFDGSVTLQQPCIAPLYGGRSALELIATLARDPGAAARDMVRAQWQPRAGTGDFEGWWREALREGVVPDSVSAIEHPALRSDAIDWRSVPPRASGIELVIAPDPRIEDGRYANNAWLQELPKPLTQLTWDNAALVAPELARRFGIHNEDVIELSRNGASVRAPAWIAPGQNADTITVHLGYGRKAAGDIGSGLGFDAFALRTADAAAFAAPVDVRHLDAQHPLASTQMHSSMEDREPVRLVTAQRANTCETVHCVEPRPTRTLYDSPPLGPYAWAMSIDLSAYIGCGACTIACQAENNIATVGKEEVRHGREMHWIRVDRYYRGSADNPRTVFQPVPCMQCEHAPCEVVCPVEASVHDAQGINVQVYNRCVGTRFCSNNCPYKVRRFNFLQYTRDEPHLNAQRNPEVTVRMRGVMEKCNYCLQRITAARIEADKDNRRIRDGEVVTACQAVCPTHAIVLGDLNDPASEVNQRKRSPLDYTLLAELNTRPRTTYLARVVNPSPALPHDAD